MQDDLKIGQIINEDRHRDAIHIAVAPMISDEILHPGQRVGIENGKVVSKSAAVYVGVVDPFLSHCVTPGSKFWLFLVPGSITSLRHEWTHPAFEENTSIESESHKWIKDYAAKIGARYEELIEAAARWVAYEDYFIQGGRWEGESLPDEFWGHYENVTSTKVPEDKRGSFFSCSC